MMEFQKKQQISKVEGMIQDNNEFEELLKNNWLFKNCYSELINLQ